MDTAQCVVCYDEKAIRFCVNCKCASGLCGRCYAHIEEEHENRHGCFYAPIPCVICKRNMNWTSIVRMLEFDIESAGENTLYDTRLINYAKQEQLNDIQRSGYYNEWNYEYKEKVVVKSK